MSAKRLILLRHGETEYNAGSRVQGQADSDLTAAGEQQAQTAAKFLAHTFDIDLLAASDLSRTRATVAPLARATGLEVTYDERLRERHFGQWQHRWHAEIAETDPQSWQRWQDVRILDAEGAETEQQVADRMVQSLTELGERLDDSQTALVVSHGMAILLGIAALIGLPDGLQVLSGMENTGWAMLQRRRDNRGWMLRHYNRNCG